MVTLEEYTSRERIQLTESIVNENVIRVSNDHTRYISIERMEYTDLKALQKEYKRIYKLLKENNVKIGYSMKISKQLTEWIKTNEYENQYKMYADKFNQLVELWAAKIEQGLYMGTSDDHTLNNVIQPLKNEIEKMFYRSEIFSQVSEIIRKLNDLENDLKHQTEYSKLYKVYL